MKKFVLTLLCTAWICGLKAADNQSAEYVDLGLRLPVHSGKAPLRMDCLLMSKLLQNLVLSNSRAKNSGPS